MQTAPRWTILAALLDRYGKGDRAAYERYLPKEEARWLHDAYLPPEKKQIAFSMAEALSWVHYSWALHYVYRQPPAMRQLFLQALPPDLSHSLSKHMEGGPVPPELSTEVKRFFLQKASEEMALGSSLPPEFIPPSALDGLLSFDKRHVAMLLSYLGLHDLSLELRTVVDKTSLAKIEELLVPAQVAYLQQAMRRPDPWRVTPAGISQWMRDKHHCYRLLQMRGLFRLGKALAGSPPLLIWHVVHRLDTGRGQILGQHAETRTSPNLEKHLVDQVARLIGQMQTHKR